MSGNPLSAVGKVFKAVTHSVIGKVVIAAAVAYFTMGLGSTIMGAMGASEGFLSSTMGTVLSGALSGSIAGAVTSAVTGQNILKGAALGSLGGAVAGGVSSYLNGAGTGAAAVGDSVGSAGADAAAGAAETGESLGNTGLAFGGENLMPEATQTAGFAPEAVTSESLAAPSAAAGVADSVPQITDVGTQTVSPLTQTVDNSLATGAGSSGPGVAAPVTGGLDDVARANLAAETPWDPATNAGGGAAAGGAVASAPTSGSTGLLSSIATFAQQNPALATAGAAGIGQGISGIAQAQGTENAVKEKAKLDAQQAQAAADRVGSSYSGLGGLLTPDQVAALRAQQPARPTPADRFNPAAYSHPGSYVYDPGVGRIVFVPNQA